MGSQQGNSREDIRSTSVAHLATLDDKLEGAHIGLLVLDVDQTTERDFMNMRPEGVSFYTTRMPYGEENTLEALKAVDGHFAQSASLILPTEELDAIAYSCTSGTMALGYDNIAARIHSTRPGLPVVTPMTAAFKAFDHMGVRKVTLLTPYNQNLTDMMAHHVIDAGYGVLNAATFMLKNSPDLQRLTPDAIIAGAKEVLHDDAQALFISCTGLRALDIVEQLEAEIGRPVFCSNQCMFWECLRHSGFTGSIEGYGELMRNF
jgi:maleate isomerase